MTQVLRAKMSRFQEMMSEQSALAAEGADEYTKYLELVWANLGCGLTSVTGFCTAINPIDFTLWTIEVFLAGLVSGIISAQVYNWLKVKLTKLQEVSTRQPSLSGYKTTSENTKKCENEDFID